MTSSARPTALVTGASSGIGYAIAVELAGRGHDIVLVARDAEALATAARDVEKRGAKAHAIVQDLSVIGGAASLVSAIKARGVSIEVLVNNAGFGVHGDFAGTSIDAELGMIRVQLDALLVLTKAFLPQMIARRGGKILNVASVYSFAPVPHQAVYGACKSFMFNFSEAVARENEGNGISVTLLCPGSTRTEFRKRAGVAVKKSGGSGMSAEDVAKAAVIGLERGTHIVVPGFWNKVFVVVCNMLPRARIAGFVSLINARRLSPGKSP